MIPFPNISPEIFSFTVAGLEVALRWYALSYIAGFVVAMYLMRYFINKEKLWKHGTAPMETEQADAFITYLIIGVIIGGRLGYVLFYNLDYYLENPQSILRVWDGGMSFHGGFIGVIIAVIGFCRFNGIRLLSAADLIAISAPPGLMFGRIANFINAELWGMPTTVAWGVVFPGERAQDCAQIVGTCARHPTQLYEAGLEGFLLFLILLFLALMGSLRKPGLVMGIFFAGYGFSRCFVEFFREPDVQFITIDNPNGFVYSVGEYGMTMGQLLSAPMFFVGIFMIIVSASKKVT